MELLPNPFCLIHLIRLQILKKKPERMANSNWTHETPYSRNNGDVYDRSLLKIPGGSSEGGARDARPSLSDFFHFYAVFAKNLAK